MKFKSARTRVQFSLAVYLFFFVALNVSVWSWFVVHRHGKHQFPLGERVERFGDIVRFTAKRQVWADYRLDDNGIHLMGTLYPRNYPPLASAIYLFLLQVCAPYAVPVFFAAVIGSLLFAAYLVWKTVARLPAYRWFIGLAIFCTAALSWGTEITLMRGNIEGILWIPVSLGASYLALRRYQASAIAFAIAACVKPYPVLWMALLATKKQFRAIVVGLLASMGVTIGALMVFNVNPIKAYRIISAPPPGTSSSFFDNYIAAFRPMDEMRFDHSLLQSIKTVARVFRNHGPRFSHYEYMHHAADPLALKLYHVYIPVAVIISLVVLIRGWKLPLINQAFAIGIGMTLLPPLAGDYTLTALLIPLGFFVIFLLQDVAEGKVLLSTSAIMSYLIPTIWIMSITPLWTLHGVLKCAALVWLLVSTLCIPLPSSLFGEVPQCLETNHMELSEAA